MKSFIQLKCPLMASPVVAGFPAPTESQIETTLDLNQYLISHPAATFFTRVKGYSMTAVGITEGDLLIVDRSLLPQDKQIVIAILNGEFTVKRLRKTATKTFLQAENPQFPSLEIKAEDQFEVWGVVTYVIHKL